MNEPADQWEPCPPGTLSQVRLRTASTGIASRPLRTGLTVGLIACLLFVGFSALRGNLSKPPSVQHPAELSCAAVVAHRDEYRAGSLDRNTLTQVESHLAVCEKCRNAYERISKRDDERDDERYQLVTFRSRSH